MEFSRQEYWSELPFPSPGDLPNLGVKSGSPALQADSLPPESPGKPKEWRVLGKCPRTFTLKRKFWEHLYLFFSCLWLSMTWDEWYKLMRSHTLEKISGSIPLPPHIGTSPSVDRPMHTRYRGVITKGTLFEALLCYQVYPFWLPFSITRPLVLPLCSHSCPFWLPVVLTLLPPWRRRISSAQTNRRQCFFNPPDLWKFLRDIFAMWHLGSHTWTTESEPLGKKLVGSFPEFSQDYSGSQLPAVFRNLFTTIQTLDIDPLPPKIKIFSS